MLLSNITTILKIAPTVVRNHLIVLNVTTRCRTASKQHKNITSNDFYAPYMVGATPLLTVFNPIFSVLTRIRSHMNCMLHSLDLGCSV